MMMTDPIRNKPHFRYNKVTARLCFRATKICRWHFLRPLQTTLLCEAIPFELLPVWVAFRNARRSLWSQ